MDYKPVDENGFAVLTISGKLVSEDFDRVVPLVEDDIAKHGRIRLLERVESFTGLDPMALWKDMRFGLPLVGKISHVALVSDAAWMRAATDVMGGLFPGKVKSFELETEEAARMWLKSVQ